MKSLICLNICFIIAGVSLFAKPVPQSKTYSISNEFKKISEKEIVEGLWYFFGNDQIQVKSQTVTRYGSNILEAQRKIQKSKTDFPPIGIIDSGLDLEVAKFENMKVFAVYDGTNNEKMFDDYGHGTGIASILVSDSNGHGMIGVAPGAPLMPLKVFQASDFRDSGAGVDFSVLEKAVETAASQGVRIINMSVAQSNKKWPRNDMAALFKKYENQILFVLAAGNDGLDLDKVPLSKLPTPVGINGKNVLIVGGHDILGKRFPTSNFGSPVEIYGPGVKLTQWRIEMGESKNDFQWILREENGTSHAAPIVSGIAALVLKVNPHFNAPQVKKILVDSAETISSQKIKKADALEAVNLAISTSKQRH